MASVTPIDSARSPLAYALRYARIGWHVFPLWWAERSADGSMRCACGQECPSPAKHPIGLLVHRGQDDATTDEARIRQWWTTRPQANIGVMLAPSGLVGVDIDPRNGGLETIDALEREHGAIDSGVLQLTGGGGEHRVFALAAEQAASLPGKLGPGVDLKRNGYLVVEPSSHMSGRAYAWEASSDPLEGAIAAPLPDWVRDMVRQMPSRSDAPATAPRRPLPDGELERLREALQVIPANDRETWLRVGMAIHNDVGGQDGFALWDAWSQSSAKYDPVDQMRVWRSFRRRPMGDAVQLPTVYGLAHEHGLSKPAPTPEVAPDLAARIAPRKTQPAAATNTDNDLDRLPTTQLQRASDWISGLFDQPTPEISVAGAIALASVVAGRVYRSEMANWPSLLMAIVGPSGIGKNYVKVGIERLLTHAGLDRLIAGDFYTHQSALYWALHQAPCHICISDEFGENFLEARKNNNANKMTVFKALKKVYSDADHIYKAESYSMGGLSKKQREEIEQRPVINPAITMLGLSTERQFWSEIKASHIEGGLLNRFLIVTLSAQRGARTERGPDNPPPELVDHIRAVRRVDEPLRHTAYDLAPNWVNVEFSASARLRFESMRAQADARGDKLEAHGLGPMTRRWRENAMRMATALAAFDRPSSPVVSADLADWACRYVSARGERAIEQLGANAGETDYAHQLNAVRGFIDAAGERGSTDYELKRGIRHIRRRDLGELIAHLAEAGAIVQVERKSEKGGRPSHAWVIAQVDE